MPASQPQQQLVGANTVDALVEHAIAQLRPHYQRRVSRAALRPLCEELARRGFRDGDLVEELAETGASIHKPTGYLMTALKRVVASGIAPPARIPDATASAPVHCGKCDFQRQIELPNGSMLRCPTCNRNVKRAG